MSSFLTALEIATAAFIRIWHFCHPREFGVDLVDTIVARLLYRPRDCAATLMGGYYEENQHSGCKRNDGIGRLLTV